MDKNKHNDLTEDKNTPRTMDEIPRGEDMVPLEEIQRDMDIEKNADEEVQHPGWKDKK